MHLTGSLHRAGMRLFTIDYVYCHRKQSDHPRSLLKRQCHCHCSKRGTKESYTDGFPLWRIELYSSHKSSPVHLRNVVKNILNQYADKKVLPWKWIWGHMPGICFKKPVPVNHLLHYLVQSYCKSLIKTVDSQHPIPDELVKWLDNLLQCFYKKEMNCFN